MRLFVAVDIGDEVRASLALELKALRKTHPDVKWVEPDRLHLTLAFLGEIPDERLSEISAAVDRAAKPSVAFSCAVKGLGWFGAERSPRVVWAGVEEALDLMVLQTGIAEGLRGIGLAPEDRAFHPHLTLGRVKSSSDGVGLAEVLKKRRDVAFGLMDVKKVSVMRSQLLPQGPEYTSMASCLL